MSDVIPSRKVRLHEEGRIVLALGQRQHLLHQRMRLLQLTPC